MAAPGHRDLQELGVDGEAENVVAAHRFQQRQCGLAAIVAVSAQQNLNVGPVLADTANDVAQNLRHLVARRSLAGPQQRQDRLARDPIEDMNRLEAGAIVVSVEEGEFLLTVHRIVGVVDVENDAPRRTCEAPAIQIDLAEPDPGQRAPIGKVLEPRQGRLAHEVSAGHGAATDGNLQRRIGAQCVDVVAILVAGRDHQHARLHHLGIAVLDASGIAFVAQTSGDRLGHAKACCDLAQHNHAAIRRQATGIERGCERLTRNG